MSGESFQKPETTADTSPEAFDVKKWRRGAALVTRSVEVCGRPDLMGEIEALDAQIVRLQAGDFDGTRDSVKALAKDLAQQREALRAEMSGSFKDFKFRGLRTGELEKIRTEHGVEHGEGITDLDYKIWAAQCIEPKMGWEDMRALHVGDDDSEGLGNYFMQTIAYTANLANTANGVDIPFSSASSSLIGTSSKS